ncbi:MAG: class I adenylate-forming enzyme family protein [Leucothrix sp.]
MSFNLANCFYQTAAKQPDNILINGPREGNVLTYSEFASKVKSLAKALGMAGVRAGDNIGLHYPNGADYIAFTYALWECGACVTPIPVELANEEKQEIFKHIHIKNIITAAKHQPLFDLVCPEDGQIELPEQAVMLTVTSNCEAPAELAAVNAAFIRFTSGTTGSAKGVVLSHETIYERIHAANEVLNIGPEDKVLWLLSMAYHFAVSIVAYLTFGATIILPQNNFGVTLLKAANRHFVTLTYGAPTHYNLMNNDNTGQRLPDTLRFTVVTTTALNPQVAEKFHQRFGRVLNETYGIIEIGLPAINASQSIEKQGSVGIPLPAYDVSLGDPNDQAGEIMVKGKGIIDAYYSPWKSRETLLQEQGGWFKTGDLGRIDNEGFLFIVGRSKEVISVGGMKFFPQEVERVLEQHPNVKAAWVAPEKDLHLGELSVANIVFNDPLNPPATDVLAAFCSASLAQYKVPKRFIPVDQLNYTASGKLIRHTSTHKQGK